MIHQRKYRNDTFRYILSPLICILSSALNLMIGIQYYIRGRSKSLLLYQCIIIYYLYCFILKKLQNILEMVQLIWYFIPIKISHLKYDLSIKNHVKNLKVLY